MNERGNSPKSTGCPKLRKHEQYVVNDKVRA